MMRSARMKRFSINKALLILGVLFFTSGITGQKTTPVDVQKILVESGRLSTQVRG